MVAITKNATGTTLTTAGNWTPAQVPTTADDVTWNLTSVSGTCTGSFGANTITFNGAASGTPVTHTGTLTLINGFTFTSTNNSQWNVGGTTGVLAVGANNQTWILNSSAWSSVAFTGSSASVMTGTATINVQKLTDGAGSADVYSIRSVANFTGTFIANSGVSFSAAFATATGAWSGANFQFETGSVCGPAINNAYFGGVGKTLTVNGDMQFGNAAYTGFVVNPNVALGAVTRTLTINADTTLAGAVSGTAGVALAKAGTAFSAVTLDATSNSIDTTLGAFTVGDYIVAYLNCASGFNLASARAFAVNGIMRLAKSTSGGLPSAHSFAAGTTFSGLGAVDVVFAATNIVTFPTGSLTGLTGTRDPGTAYAANVPLSGLTLFTSPNYATARQAYAEAYELPARVAFACNALTNTAATGRLYYIGAGATYSGTRIDMVLRDATFPAQNINEIYANCSDANPLIIGGGVKRFGVSATQTLTLRGTSTADNAITGTIDGNSLGALGITKADAGKWVLSGSNVHTGVTTVNAGTLAAASSAALGTTGAVTVAGTGQLMLQGGLTVNKSSGAFTVHANNPIVSVGDNTLQTAGITLGGTTTFEVTTGNRLAIANSGAITDGASTFGLTKTGDGELALAAFANTYDGAVTVTAGTLAIGSVGALGTGVATVELTGNLKYTGTGETLSKATQLNGSAPSFEASGSGALTVSNLSTSVSTKTLTLKGSNTGANTITSSLTDNSGVLSLAKEDAGTWVVTTRTYSGTTAVNAGTLRCEATNSATTTGAVTIGASGTVELVTNTLASSGAGNGEVLGTGNVTCNGGIIKTRGGTTQKGQVRYGGNLTFGAGSSLYIGAAA